VTRWSDTDSCHFGGAPAAGNPARSKIYNILLLPINKRHDVINRSEDHPLYVLFRLVRSHVIVDQNGARRQDRAASVSRCRIATRSCTLRRDHLALVVCRVMVWRLPFDLIKKAINEIFVVVANYKRGTIARFPSHHVKTPSENRQTDHVH
jgi:hypothetical protein